MKIIEILTFLLLAMSGCLMANPVSGGSSCQVESVNLFTSHVNPDSAPDSQAPNTTCPVGERVRSHWPSNRASTCPWTYETDYDANRFPAVISQAVCRCSDSCLDPFTNEPNVDLQCTPVTYNIPVLRLGECVGGVYQVEESLETVTVACACLRRHGSARRAPGIIG